MSLATRNVSTNVLKPSFKVAKVSCKQFLLLPLQPNNALKTEDYKLVTCQAVWKDVRLTPSRSSLVAVDLPVMDEEKRHATKCYLEVRKLVSQLDIFLNTGQPQSLFGVIIPKLFTISITADLLTINWTCLRLVDKTCPHNWD